MNMDEEEKGKIERLNDRLYSRTRYRDPLDKHAPIKQLESANVEEKWQTPELDEMLRRERVIPRVNPFIKKVFIFEMKQRNYLEWIFIKEELFLETCLE